MAFARIWFHALLVVAAGGLLAWFSVRDGLLGWLPGYYPWENIQIVPVAARHLPERESSRVLSDLPSMLLGISALGSAVLYCRLRKYLDSLEEQLRDNLLISDPPWPGSARVCFETFRTPVRRSLLFAFWLASIGMGFGLFFIARNVHLYPKDWWVLRTPKSGWFEHLAYFGRVGTWMFIGAEGVYTALAAMASFLSATTSLKRLQRLSQPPTHGVGQTAFHFKYVEPWQRPQQGWTVLWQLMRLKVWGVLFVLPALAGLYLILAQRESLRPLLGLIVLGILIVSLRQFGILGLVPRLYEDTVGREIAKNNTALLTAGTEQELLASTRRNEHLIAMVDNQRGFSLLVGRAVTALTLATSIAGVVVPFFAG